MLVNFVNTCNQAVIEVTQKADMELRCTLNMRQVPSTVVCTHTYLSSAILRYGYNTVPKKQ